MVKCFLENKIEAELVRRVEAIGGKAEKVVVLGRRGFFDRLVVLPGGRVVFAETKKPVGGKVSIHQRSRHTDYAALGVEVRVIKTMEDIDKLMSGS